MNRYRLLFSIILLLCFSPCLRAGEWQWSVTLDGFVSNETNRNPTAFLWIPADCMRVKTILVGQHNMSEETLFDNPLFREKMQKLGIGFVWITPGIDQQWDVSKGTQRIFEKMMADLADVSGYSELKNVPIVPIGHSAMATYPWNFAAWNAERTLAVISLNGDAPRTNLTGYGRENLEWGRTRNINGIPGLMIEGEYEWWEARVNPALAFRMMYPESCISFLCDTGRGHFDVAGQTADYIALFLRKALEYRLSGHPSLNEPVRLKKLTEGLTEVEGMPLNFKVYYVIDVNAFACADGSVRVFSSLMDIMTDEELLGVIGHEVGHVAHKDSKNGFRTALLTSALKDGISSQGGKAAALTDSQLGDLGEALVNATYSQKQECAADDYGYEFLKKAGKNPWAMALSFQKLKKLQEEAGAQKSSKLNQLFSTHPDLDARIQRMEERATSEGIEKPANTMEETAK